MFWKMTFGTQVLWHRIAKLMDTCHSVCSKTFQSSLYPTNRESSARQNAIAGNWWTYQYHSLQIEDCISRSYGSWLNCNWIGIKKSNQGIKMCLEKANPWRINIAHIGTLDRSFTLRNVTRTDKYIFENHFYLQEWHCYIKLSVL